MLSRSIRMFSPHNSCKQAHPLYKSSLVQFGPKPSKPTHMLDTSMYIYIYYYITCRYVYIYIYTCVSLYTYTSIYIYKQTYAYTSVSIIIVAILETEKYSVQSPMLNTFTFGNIVFYLRYLVFILPASKSNPFQAKNVCFPPPNKLRPPAMQTKDFPRKTSEQ